jgi:hypothetical protein
MLYLLTLAIFVIMALARRRSDRRRAEWFYEPIPHFNQRFPRIDDDEFLRRMGPGANREVALRVRRIVSESLGFEYKRVYPEQRLADDLGCD